MKRAALIALWLVCWLSVPSRADAYFWRWLDDLSGPKFEGWRIELRMLCRSENAEGDQAVQLVLLAVDLTRMLEVFSRAESSAQAPARESFSQARQVLEIAQRKASEAVALARQHNTTEASAKAAEALAERARALGIALAALQLPGHPNFTNQEFQPQFQSTSLFSPGLSSIGFGVSACKAIKNERRRSFVNVNFGFGKETDLEAGKVDARNRMLTLGGSYHYFIQPWLMIGHGAGIAWFSSEATDSFTKLYIEPVMFDVRPLALGWGRLGKAEATNGWWRHVLVLRAGAVTFPAGFEGGSFAGSPEAFEAELVKYLAFQVDLEPVVRRVRHKY